MKNARVTTAETHLVDKLLPFDQRHVFDE